MIEVDVKEFTRNMTGIQSALLSASSRTVRSMAFNAKDRTLDSLNKYVDKPTPFTMRKGAYNASPPKLVGGDLVSEFSVAPLQSTYLLPYVFDGATRKPGDPGAPNNRIWLPTFFKGSKNKFGGLAAGFVKKIALLIARNKKGKGAGKKVHYGFGKLKTHGKPSYGLWKFPGRKSYTTTKPYSAQARRRASAFIRRQLRRRRARILSKTQVVSCCSFRSTDKLTAAPKSFMQLASRLFDTSIFFGSEMLPLRALNPFPRRQQDPCACADIGLQYLAIGSSWAIHRPIHCRRERTTYFIPNISGLSATLTAYDTCISVKVRQMSEGVKIWLARYSCVLAIVILLSATAPKPGVR